MDLKYVDAESLHEHPQNPKRHTNQQLTHLSNSVSHFGWTQPIVADENGQILIGHGRWRAVGCKGKVPVVTLKGLSEEAKLALMVADNTTNLETGFDPIPMEQIIAILQEQKFPLQELGLLAEVLGETGERAADENKLKQSFERYLEGETKRLVLYYPPDECDDVEERIDALMELEQIPMRCDLVLAMLLEYEREHGQLKID